MADFFYVDRQGLSPKRRALIVFDSSNEIFFWSSSGDDFRCSKHLRNIAFGTGDALTGRMGKRQGL
jgi:hypothetical protein